ncbi:VWA domain-containing protein [Acidaminobacter sp. JC074]|uniref:vWA domain-containing protein n=1 Tax=Acidaminobacter sp. JC074 TaxID=2530199 RepID=UPI001F114EB8|nr:vWA domain-containing protein [Acidaminobacter sp. JC074]MCH4886313.1 VWA domain-containing protein [Acidaminobacter sp. JC074]
MKKTQVIFILDRSGSMAGLESDTIGGFNAMLTKQKKEEGHVYVTTVLFDDRYEVLHDGIAIDKAKLLTSEDYFVRGTTALLDAMGKSIESMIRKQKNKDDKVLFVIITDGYENASKHYSQREVKRMIERQKEAFGWEFVFLGANIDAIEVADSYGISKEKAVNYHADQAGTELNFSAISAVVSDIRHDKAIDESWKREIDEDYIKRS